MLSRRVALILLAFGLACLGIDRESLWRDEVDSIRFADDIWQRATAGGGLRDTVKVLGQHLTQPGYNGPLYFLALEPWLSVAGRSELALRFPSVAAGMVALALCSRLAAHLLGRRVGELTALLGATNPYLVWYAGEGKMYTLVTALALLSTYLWVRALELGGRRRWVAFVAATTALFYAHVLSPLLLLVHAVFALVLHRRELRQPALWVSAAALTLPYLPLLVWQWPLLARPIETGFAYVSLPLMFRRLVEVYSRGVTGFPAAFPALLLVGGIAMSLCASGRRSSRSARSALLAWMVLPVVAVYLISLRRPLFTERYLIWTLPAWLVLAADGLVGLTNQGGWRRRAASAWCGLLLTTSLVVVGFQWGTPIRPDLRSASRLIARQVLPGNPILFQIPYLQHSFDYYAPETDYVPIEGPYTNQGATPQEVGVFLQRATAGHSVVWLLLSEIPMWDQRNMTLDWFAARGELDWHRFHGVDAVRWQREAASTESIHLPLACA